MKPKPVLQRITSLGQRTAHPLSTHPKAALEYWFFKVNAGPVALLVDWVARRRKRSEPNGPRAFVRLSVHSPRTRAVLFRDVVEADLLEEVRQLPGRTTGRIGEIQWALEGELVDGWIAPDIFPASALRMADLSLVSAPQVVFNGRVEVDGRRMEVVGAPGMMSHYWGRNLPREWWWISAGRFDRPDLAVECAVLRTGLWGSPLHVQTAYLHLKQEGRHRLLTSPPQRVVAHGTPDSFEVLFGNMTGRSIRLLGRGRDYADLGERIVNTLVGDLEVWEGGRLLGRAVGSAGLERRRSP